MIALHTEGVSQQHAALRSRRETRVSVQQHLECVLTRTHALVVRATQQQVDLAADDWRPRLTAQLDDAKRFAPMTPERQWQCPPGRFLRFFEHEAHVVEVTVAALERRFINELGPGLLLRSCHAGSVLGLLNA